jgi:hypothetical protein
MTLYGKAGNTIAYYKLRPLNVLTYQNFFCLYKYIDEFLGLLSLDSDLYLNPIQRREKSNSLRHWIRNLKSRFLVWKKSKISKCCLKGKTSLHRIVTYQQAIHNFY